MKQLKPTVLSLATRNKSYTFILIKSLHKAEMQWTDLTVSERSR